MLLTGEVRCNVQDCGARFAYRFSTSNVDARVESGGRVMIKWPEPKPDDVPPGWQMWRKWYGTVCPLHAEPYGNSNQ